jgi:hypothetical protein
MHLCFMRAIKLCNKIVKSFIVWDCLGSQINRDSWCFICYSMIRGRFVWTRSHISVIDTPLAFDMTTCLLFQYINLLTKTISSSPDAKQWTEEWQVATSLESSLGDAKRKIPLSICCLTTRKSSSDGANEAISPCANFSTWGINDKHH